MVGCPAVTLLIAASVLIEQRWTRGQAASLRPPKANWLDRDRTTTGTGTGLGRSIVRFATVAQGGTVQAEARPEGGLAVRVTLQASDETKQSHESRLRRRFEIQAPLEA
jgi:hypothetical protein